MTEAEKAAFVNTMPTGYPVTCCGHQRGFELKCSVCQIEAIMKIKAIVHEIQNFEEGLGDLIVQHIYFILSLGNNDRSRP